MRAAAASLAVLLLALPPATAWACAACACGDPTLTVMGAEQPFHGRRRFSAELLYRTDGVGAQGAPEWVDLQQLRLTLGLAYAPLDWLMVSGSVPLVLQDSFTAAGRAQAMALGDSQLSAKAYVFRDRAFGPSHLVGLLVGAKLPTGSPPHEHSGPVDADLHSTGSWDAALGVSYAFFQGDLSAYASATLSVPLLLGDVVRPGRSLRATVAGQWQLWPQLALRAGGDLRADGRTFNSGVLDEHSGGTVVFATGEAIYSPRTDLVLVASARVPVLNLLHGIHREGPFLGLSVVLDL
jgi:hypothetical protein